MTAEPTTPLPESPFCRVRARVASIWADGTDAGISPDWRPAVGEKVTLTPSIGAQLLVYDVAGPEPIIVTVERVQCEVDADGWLVKADGRPVYIAPTDDPLLSATGWTWTATIKGKSITFSAPAGGVVDLALYVATPAVDATEYVSVVQIVADYITANPPDVEQAVADYLTANPPAAAPDATSAAKGLVRLAGDLAGTADAPTVPGLAGKADTGHGHAISDVSGLQTALDGKQPAGSYAPASHTHTAAQISDSTATGRSVLTAADAAAARTAIGAGTSNLAIGTTGTTAAAGNRAATETATGMVELATTAEATAGTDTARAVTPAGVKAVADTKAPASHTHAYADLTGKPTLGTAAATAATDYATATQGAKADTALQVATPQPINAKTAAYTLVASDAGKLVQMTLTTAADLTVPASVFTAGQRVDLSDRGTARVTVVAGAGMTINPPPGGTLVMEGRYTYASLVFVSATEADLVGLVAGA